MGRARAVALGVLSCALLVLGVAPQASAAPAPFTLSWYSYGGTLPASQTTSICAVDRPFQPGQTMRVQAYFGGAWHTMHRLTGARLQGQWCATLAATELVTKPGRFRFRALTQVSTGAPVTDVRTTLTVTRDSGDASTEAPSVTTTTAGRTVAVHLSSAWGELVELQRRSAAGWVRVGQLTAPRSRTAATVKLPLPPQAGLSTYRVVNHATSWSDSSVTPTFTVHQTDAVAFRDYIAQARHYMAPYCPHTPIYVDTPEVAGTGPGTIGWAEWFMSGGMGQETLTNWIALRSGLTGTQLKHVALHECGHVVQSRANIQGRYDAEELAAEKLYPGVGKEGQADCMAFLYARSVRDLYYVRGCTAAQLDDARRMWRTYGTTHQGASTTWST